MESMKNVQRRFRERRINRLDIISWVIIISAATYWGIHIIIWMFVGSL